MTTSSRLSASFLRAAAAAALALAAAGCPLQVPGVDGGLSPDISFSGGGVTPGGSITLTQAGASGSITVTAVVNNGGGTPQWTSSDPTVAQVTGSGSTVTITPLKNGAVTITVTAGGKTSRFTVVVQLAPVPASLSIATGPAAVALGETQAFTVTALDGSGAPITGLAGFTWGADGDLFTLTAGADSATVQVKAVDAGQGTLTVTRAGLTASKGLHATAASVTVAAAAQTSVAGTAVAVTASANGATQGVTGRAGRTVWTVAGSGCSVSPTVGSATSVNATGGVACVVTATLDGTLTASTTVSFSAPQVPASVTIAGADVLDVNAAAATYTATVKDAKGNTIAGAAVTWSSPLAGALAVTPSGAAAAVVANVVGALTLQAAVTGTQITGTKAIAANPVSLDCSPASVNLLQSPSKQAPIYGHASLRAKDGAGTVVRFAANVPFGPGGLTETHGSDPGGSFNFLTTGLNADGTLALTFYDVSTVGTARTATLTAFGRSATLAVTVIAPDAVALALKPGDTQSVGSSMTVTPSVTLAGGSVDGAVVSIAQGGDAIFSAATVPATVTVPATFSPLVAHLGKATLTPSALGKTGSAVTIWGVPATLGAAAGPVVLSGSSAYPLQLGAAATTVTVVAQNASRATIDLAAEGARGGTLAGSITGGAAVTTTCVASGAGLACPLAPAAAGNATLHVVWSSQDGARTVTADFPLTVTAAAAPTWTGATFDVTWTGPLAYSLSFSPAQAAAGALAYDLYASNEADADTDDAVLFKAANKTAGIATSGTGPLAAGFTAPAFSSRWAFGIKANTSAPVSSDSVAQRFALKTTAPSGAPGVPFLAGRTVFEVSLAGVVNPLFTVGAFATGQLPERTAPRLSALDATPTRGLAGVAISGGAQQLYARSSTDTGAAVKPSGASVQTDAASCGSTSLVRPTVALQALVNGAATPIFTVTPQYHACDSALLIAVGAGGGQDLAGHFVDQVAQVGDGKLLITDRGSLALLDLGGASPVETAVTSGKLAGGALIAAVPAPGQAGSATAYTLDAANGLRSYDLGALPAAPATVSDAATVFAPASAFAAAGTPVRMVAAEPAHLVVELAGTGGAHTLWSIATAAGAPAPVKLVDASVILDQPTLGSTTAAGH